MREPIMTRVFTRDLWRAHGGSQHGPRVETMTMPEASFYDFVAAVEAAVRADERGKVIEECARMAERGYWSSALGSEGTGQAIARAIRKLGETHT